MRSRWVSWLWLSSEAGRFPEKSHLLKSNTFKKLRFPIELGRLNQETGGSACQFLKGTSWVKFGQMASEIFIEAHTSELKALVGGICLLKFTMQPTICQSESCLRR